MTKAMIEMWIKTTVQPIAAAAIKAAIPAETICGALVGAAINVARTAGWKKEQLVEVVSKHWDETSTGSAPRADAG